jgi:hypothetical protein
MNALGDLLLRPVPELQRCGSDENLILQRQTQVLLDRQEAHLDDSTLDINPRKISTDEPSLDRNASTAELISVQQQFDRTFATLGLAEALPPVPHTHDRGIPKPTRHMSIPMTTKDVTASFVQDVRSYSMYLKSQRFLSMSVPGFLVTVTCFPRQSGVGNC